MWINININFPLQFQTTTESFKIRRRFLFQLLIYIYYVNIKLTGLFFFILRGLKTILSPRGIKGKIFE